MISQITAAGARPALRAMSTDASVCPARTNVPPTRAISGNTWPGVVMSSRVLSGLIATAIVRARSAAEMPVVTPSRASIDTVNAVWCRVPFCWLMSGRPSFSTRARVSARQIRPRAWRAMKLIASGVANWAGTTRSPSFSRSSSSTRMNIRPLRASSISSSALDRYLDSSTETSASLRARFSMSLRLREPGHIACQHVDLDVDRIAGGKRAETGDGRGVGNDVHSEGIVLNLVHRQRYAVHGYASLDGDEAREVPRHAKPPAGRGIFRRGRDRMPATIHMAGDDMAPQFIADLERTFKVDPRAG